MTNTMGKEITVTSLSDNLASNPIIITAFYSRLDIINNRPITLEDKLIDSPLLIGRLTDMDSPCHIADIMVIDTTKIHG